MSKCRLCLQEKKLIKAHVIPESFLALPTAEEGPAKLISDKKGFHPKKTLTGIYDKDILCEACDGELGVLDQHAVEKLLRNSAIADFKVGDQIIGRQYDGADPELLSRFIKSVLWRASICSAEFFERVRLGPYENLIRDEILGRVDNNGRVQPIISEFNKADLAILNPHATRTNGVRFWAIYANRFIFYVKVDKQSMPAVYSDFMIQKGRPVYSVVRSWEGSKEYPVMVKLVKSNPRAFR